MFDFSKIILGTAQFGLDYGINNFSGKISEKEIFQILDFAYQNGLNTLDTAPSYGNSEYSIGEYLKFNPKKKFKIITKISSANISLEEQLIGSLKNLKIEKVDVLLFHSLDLYIKFFRKLPHFIKEFKGKCFDELGVSIYYDDKIELIIEDSRLDRIQLPFNLLDNSLLRKEVVLKLKSKRKKVDARSIFLQGLFFKPLEKLSTYFKFINDELTHLHNLSNEFEISIESMALNYVLSQQFLDHTIIGVDSLKQLRCNIINTNKRMPSELINRIDSICVKNPEYLNPIIWPK
jgi:aryl-alcohol dehydrogenase-like predicted oxidoreductase